MSFYGSVYYQLIDTFSKASMTNTGLNGITFASSPSTTQLNIEAVGRKGVLDFRSGNKWINFSINSDANNNYFTIWHGKPDDGGKIELNSFKSGNPNNTSNTSPLVLKPGDKFTIQTFKFDEAGHIDPKSITTVYYQLPISEMDERVGQLEEDVGKLKTTDGTHTSDISSNKTRLTLLEKFYGKSNAEIGSKFFPTTGKNADWTKEQFKFPNFFGSVDAIRSNIFKDVNSTKTVSDAIIEINNTLSTQLGQQESNLKTTQDLVDTHTTSIGTLTTNLNNLTTKVNNLISQDISILKNTDDIHSKNISNLESEIDGVDGLKSRVQALEDRILALENS